MQPQAEELQGPPETKRQREILPRSFQTERALWTLDFYSGLQSWERIHPSINVCINHTCLLFLATKLRPFLMAATGSQCMCTERGKEGGGGRRRSGEDITTSPKANTSEHLPRPSRPLPWPQCAGTGEPGWEPRQGDCTPAFALANQHRSGVTCWAADGFRQEKTNF